MPAMDPKILAAVFASIAAITVGTGGTGDIDSFQNFENIQPDKITDMLGNFNKPSTDFLNNFNKKPVPNNSVTITAETGSKPVNLNLDADYIELNNFQKFVSAKKNISSNDNLTFRDYSGSISLSASNMTRIKGSAKGFSSSGVSISSNTDLNGYIEAKKIQVRNVSREKISLKNVDFKMNSEEGTDLENENAKFNINSFSGNITYFKQNKTILFEGKVDKFSSGGATFSG